MILAHTAYPSDSDRAVLIVLQNGKKMQIECSARQYLAGVEEYNRGAMIQRAFRFLTTDEREFLMSGLSPEEFSDLFGEEDENAGDIL